MKHIGNISEYLFERNSLLFESFKAERETYPKRGMTALCEAASRHSAPRFYVGEERACDVISAILKGRNPVIRSEARRRMYDELCRLTQEIKSENPEMSMEKAVFEAVNRPAPEFYLSVATAVSIVYEEIRREAHRKRAELLAKFGHKVRI